MTLFSGLQYKYIAVNLDHIRLFSVNMNENLSVKDM